MAKLNVKIRSQKYPKNSGSPNLYRMRPKSKIKSRLQKRTLA